MPFKNIKKSKSKQKKEKLLINKDIEAAEKAAKKYNLFPELDLIDAGRSDEVSKLIMGRQTELDSAAERDPEQQALLETMKAGLGGLTAEENTALREQAQAEIDRNYQTQLRDLARLGSARGVRGAAAQAGFGDLGRSRISAQQALENKLLTDNIAIQDARRSGYGSFLDNLISGEFQRREVARGGLERMTEAARLDELNRQLFNLEQQRRMEAGRGSTIFGLVATRGNRRNQKQAVELEKQRIAADAAANQSFFEQQKQNSDAIIGLLSQE